MIDFFGKIKVNRIKGEKLKKVIFSKNMVKSKKILQGRLSKQPRTSFPSLKELELVRRRIKNIPNKKGEFLREVH